MSQISLPIRIFLVVAVVGAAAYFLVLRPKDSSPPPKTPAASSSTDASNPATRATAPATGTTQPATSTNSSPNSSAAPSAQTTPGTVPETSTTGTPQATPIPGPISKASLRELPRAVRVPIQRKQILVLLVWNKQAADDQWVRRSFRHVNLHKGKVATAIAPISSISKYGPITRGVEVEQTPSVIVVNKHRQAQLLTGFVDMLTINQAVSDALHSSR